MQSILETYGHDIIQHAVVEKNIAQSDGVDPRQIRLITISKKYPAGGNECDVLICADTADAVDKDTPCRRALPLNKNNFLPREVRRIIKNHIAVGLDIQNFAARIMTYLLHMKRNKIFKIPDDL